MTVGELGRRMTHRELVEWRAWHGVEPRGEERGDWLAGWLGLVLVSVNARRRDRAGLAWGDFVPRFRREPAGEPASVSDQVRAVFRAFKRKG